MRVCAVCCVHVRRSLHRTSSSGERSLHHSESVNRLVDGLQLVMEVEFKRLQVGRLGGRCFLGERRRGRRVRPLAS